jgi:hypothetical protein
MEGQGPGWRRLGHSWSWNEIEWASKRSTGTLMSIIGRAEVEMLKKVDPLRAECHNSEERRVQVAKENKHQEH